MSIPAVTFYKKASYRTCIPGNNIDSDDGSSSDSDAESLCRWGNNGNVPDSHVVIPASDEEKEDSEEEDLGSPLSAPSTGFSSPEGSVNTSGSLQDTTPRCSSAPSTSVPPLIKETPATENRVNNNELVCNTRPAVSCRRSLNAGISSINTVKTAAVCSSKTVVGFKRSLRDSAISVNAKKPVPVINPKPIVSCKVDASSVNVLRARRVRTVVSKDTTPLRPVPFTANKKNLFPTCTRFSRALNQRNKKNKENVKVSDLEANKISQGLCDVNSNTLNCDLGCDDLGVDDLDALDRIEPDSIYDSPPAPNEVNANVTGDKTKEDELYCDNVIKDLQSIEDSNTDNSKGCDKGISNVSVKSSSPVRNGSVMRNGKKSPTIVSDAAVDVEVPCHHSDSEQLEVSVSVGVSKRRKSLKTVLPVGLSVVRQTRRSNTGSEKGKLLNETEKGQQPSVTKAVNNCDGTVLRTRKKTGKQIASDSVVAVDVSSHQSDSESEILDGSVETRKRRKCSQKNALPVGLAAAKQTCNSKSASKKGDLCRVTERVRQLSESDAMNSCVKRIRKKTNNQIVSDTDSDVDDPSYHSDSESDEYAETSERKKSSQKNMLPIVLSARTRSKAANNERGHRNGTVSEQRSSATEAINNSDAENNVNVPVSAEWKKEDIDEMMIGEGNFTEPDFIKSPVEYFRYFFDSEILNLIVEQTNLYSIQKNSPINTNLQEIQAFFGIWIYMGISKLPSIEDYWAGETRVPQVADVMSRTRFKKLRSHLHIADNEAPPNNDRYRKVRPLIAHLRKKCRDLEQEYKNSVDESMCPYKGTRAGNLRQYVKNKPTKWGFKFFVRAGTSGTVYDFLPYGGSNTFESEQLTPAESAMGQGAQVVITLCKTIPSPRLSLVVFDNWFAGIPLVMHLKQKMNLLSLGTIRKDRLKDCPLLSDKELTKLGRGAFDYRSYKDEIIIVKWHDRKCVTIISSVAGVYPVGSARRFDKSAKAKVDVPCPKVISMYNSSMGGVDLFDMLKSLYRLPTKARKWYFSIIGFSVDLALVNSWLLYRRDCKIKNCTQEVKSSKDFRLRVHAALVGPEKKKGRPSVDAIPARKKIVSPTAPRPVCDIRYDGVNHLPVWCLKSRCRYCVDGYTRFMCSKCEMPLCLAGCKNCFVLFHTKTFPCP